MKPIDEAYADCIDHKCATCGAVSGEWCVNPINNRAKAIPCVRRGKPTRAYPSALTGHRP